MNRGSRRASPPLPPTRLCFPTYTFIGVSVLLGMAGISWLLNRPNQPQLPARVGVETDAPAAEAAQVAAPAVPPRSASKSAPSTATAHAPSEISPLTARPGSATAEQTIRQLTELQISGGKLTPEQGKQILERLQQLVAEGPAALPAIRAFLDQNQDWSFGKWTGGLNGPSSIRTGLIDALRQIGGPDGVALSQQVLETTADPLEIALLARNLDQAEPGQHGDQVVQSANNVLDAVANGTLTNLDVGPLFQVLENYGGGATASQIEKLAPKFGYYADMALAGMPAGQGIASLARLATDSSPEGIGNRDFALQMLAQDSAQHPDAEAALSNLAGQKNIPDSAWRGIADVLSGMTYQFSRSYPDNVFAPVDGPDFRNHRQQDGNQNFVSTVAQADVAASDISQRLSVIDRLLAAASGNPAAVDALNQARAKLSGTTVPK